MLLPARTDDSVAPRGSVAAPLAQISAATWLLCGLTVAGAVLRFATLGKQSFWLDEALAARELHMSFGAMLSAIAPREPNPPLFFVLAWPWAHVFGTTEAGIRSLSAVAGTALIPIAYLSGRQLVSRSAGLVAAAFVAFSPFMIWYSQEAREYMLLAAFCGASFLFFARSWERPERRNVAWWTAFSALALLTHYFAAFVVVPEALALLWRSRTRMMVIALGVLVAVEATLLPHFVSHASRPAGWIGSFPLSYRLKQAPAAFALGNLDQGSTLSYALIGLAVLCAVVIALLIIGSEDAQLRGAGVAAGIGVAGVAVPLLLAVAGRDYFVPRALIGAWLPLSIVVAAACTAPRARLPGAVLGIVTLGAFAFAWAKIEGNRQYQRPDWRGVAHALGPASVPRAVAAYDGGFAAVPIALYLGGQGLSPGDPRRVTVDEIDVVGGRWQTTPQRPPGGARLVGTAVDGPYLVRRFALPAPVRLTAAQIADRAGGLLTPAVAGTAVLVQPQSH